MLLSELTKLCYGWHRYNLPLNSLHYAIQLPIITSKGVDIVMPKSSSVYTRVEPEIKEQAEEVLSQLGIPMANAINLYLRQIVLKKGIPFDVRLPHNAPLNFHTLTAEQFDAEIQKGFDDLDAGRVVSSTQVRAEIERQYGI